MYKPFWSAPRTTFRSEMQLLIRVRSWAFIKPKQQHYFLSLIGWWSEWIRQSENTSTRLFLAIRGIETKIFNFSWWYTDPLSTNQPASGSTFRKELWLPCDLVFGCKPREDIAREDYVSLWWNLENMILLVAKNGEIYSLHPMSMLWCFPYEKTWTTEEEYLRS